jgi:hypothetical protein
MTHKKEICIGTVLLDATVLGLFRYYCLFVLSLLLTTNCKHRNRMKQALILFEWRNSILEVTPESCAELMEPSISDKAACTFNNS